MPPMQGRLTNAGAPSLKRTSSDRRSVASKDERDGEIIVTDYKKIEIYERSGRR